MKYNKLALAVFLFLCLAAAADAETYANTVYWISENTATCLALQFDANYNISKDSNILLRVGVATQNYNGSCNWSESSRVEWNLWSDVNAAIRCAGTGVADVDFNNNNDGNYFAWHDFNSDGVCTLDINARDGNQMSSTTTDYVYVGDLNLTITQISPTSCTRGSSCVLQAYVTGSDITHARALASINYPGGTAYVTSQSMTEQSTPGYYSYTFTTPNTGGTYTGTVDIYSGATHASKAISFTVSGAPAPTPEPTPTPVPGGGGGGGGGAVILPNGRCNIEKLLDYGYFCNAEQVCSGRVAWRIKRTGEFCCTTPCEPRPPEKSFSTDVNEFAFAIEQGQSAKKFLTITNTGEVSLDMAIDLSDLQGFVEFIGGMSEFSFSLAPGKTKTFEIEFMIDKEQESALYVRQILITANGIQKAVLVALSVETAGALLDIVLEIPDEYRNVYAGDTMMAIATIYNLGAARRVDIAVEFSIKDPDGVTLLSETETYAVETRMSVSKYMQIPADMPIGRYILAAQATYDSQAARASNFFTVLKPVPLLERPPEEIPLWAWVLVAVASVLVLSFAAVIAFTLKEIMEIHKVAPRIAEKAAKPAEAPRVQIRTGIEERLKLEGQLRLLEEAKAAGAITRATYQKEKKLIEDALKNAKK